jgi:hypothetical protein
MLKNGSATTKAVPNKLGMAGSLGTTNGTTGDPPLLQIAVGGTH